MPPAPDAPIDLLRGLVSVSERVLQGLPGVVDHVSNLLQRVPGVIGACVCLDGASAQTGTGGSCTCKPTGGTPPHGVTPVVLPLETERRRYGEITLSIADPRAYGPMAAPLADFARHLALVYEARDRATRADAARSVPPPPSRLSEPLFRDESRIQAILDVIPVPMWEEDLTDLFVYFEQLTARGVDDIGAWLMSHPEGIAEAASRVRILAVNRAAVALHEAPDAPWLLDDITRGFTPESFEGFSSAIIAIAKGQPQAQFDSVIGTATGKRRDVEVFVRTFHDASVGPRALVSMIDITDRKRIETTLRQLNQAVEQSPVSILITAPDGAIEYVNPNFTAVTGYTADEVLGANPRILKSGETPSAEYAGLWNTVLAGETWQGEFHNRKKSGELYWERSRISPILDRQGRVTHLLGVKEDITAHKRLEEDLRRSQRMEAFGQLAGGVAHDFNNLLTVIQGNVAVALAEVTDPEVNAALGDIAVATDRAASLTRQLLMFSRRQATQQRTLDLNELVSNLTRMLRRLLGEHVRLATHFGPGQLAIHADAGMVEQVLMNLTVNARDALPSGGEITVRTDRVDVDARHAARHDGARAGAFVRLTVEDEGTGISPEDLPRIFEPFFTTKEVGRGTGLGLATVFGIVEQHHGWIEVDSRLGRGTVFRVYLPFAPVRSAPGAAALADNALRGTETVLLVEDEAAVRALAERILTSRGYRVLPAASGVDALDVWARHGAAVDLVITDMVMPGGIDGRTLGERLRADRPDVRVLYTSGYTDDMLGPGAHLRASGQFLEKPYNPERLLHAVRKALR